MSGVPELVSSLTQLLELMRAHGASRIYTKKLAPNDNSKNQVYLGGNFSALNIIPHGEIYNDREEQAGSKRDRAKAAVRFFWVNQYERHLAPDANLILYPKYPEIRISGFLKGCKAAPNDVMTVRDEGRVLVLGITPAGDVLAFAAFADHPVATEIHTGTWDQVGVFLELPVTAPEAGGPREQLLAHLKRVYDLQWIMSQKLTRYGVKAPYAARNGGGYTLEAELGVTPNGCADPDFMGWEVKQYGVTDFTRYRPKSPVTLMTPEPTGGVYKHEGVGTFISRYGYADRSGQVDRFNIGGIYVCNGPAHSGTGLRAALEGFDAVTGQIRDLDGGIMLLDRDDNVAASWSIKNMMEHWQRKHAQAAYVPSLFRTPPPEYRYGPRILMCEQTDFILFLKAFSQGVVYYDPAIKLENASSARPAVKRRSQFRVAHQDITAMYYKHEIVTL